MDFKNVTALHTTKEEPEWLSLQALLTIRTLGLDVVHSHNSVVDCLSGEWYDCTRERANDFHWFLVWKEHSVCVNTVTQRTVAEVQYSDPNYFNELREVIRKFS